MGVGRIKIGCFALAAAFWGFSAQAADSLKTYSPEQKDALRLALVILGDTHASEGVGIAVDYDVLLLEPAGPGRLLLGPTFLAGMATEDSRFLGCDTQESETILSTGANLRWVLDIHEVFRPWFGLGLELHWSDYSREVDQCSPQLGNVQDTDLGLGIHLGVGLDLEVEPIFVTVSFNSHDAPDSFSGIRLGLGWRF